VEKIGRVLTKAVTRWETKYYKLKVTSLAHDIQNEKKIFKKKVL
jgi:hypothetical protein